MSRPKLPLIVAVGAWLASLPLIIGVATKAPWVHAFDQPVINAVTAWRPAELTHFLLVITASGNPASVVGLAAVFAFALIYSRRRHQAAFVGINVAGLSAVNHLLKQWLQRPRPFIADPTITPLTAAGGFSFPSGHASGAMLLYGSLILLTTLWSWPPKRRWLTRLLAGLMILLIGYSRIYVQVHYPSDVLAGYLTALGSLCLLWWLAYPQLAAEQHQLTQDVLLQK
ncbi:phosphatase PAP2 family protein [Lacticaseibacillus baoqingensis]|uniref:Phosphatase PAP2 family protein n=1 Tax=Lacticaseibacillus baoqingensis TaxID=2486013 RepID=A0ABW4E5E8_9LACO|nr:phosphatase PAP2 family protein [Lacticaseibacillus baoqingensis]